MRTWRYATMGIQLLENILTSGQHVQDKTPPLYCKDLEPGSKGNRYSTIISTSKLTSGYLDVPTNMFPIR